MKRLLAVVVFAASLCFFFVSFKAPPSVFETRVAENGVVIVGFFDPTATDVVVPAQIDGRPVVEIDEGAFAGSSLTSFSVDPANPRFQTVDGVLFTADGKTLVAFPPRKAATKYALPDGCERIGDAAFDGCNALQTVAIPSNVREIGEDAFAWCGALRTVEIADGAEKIGDHMFCDCDALRSVAIPSSVREIGDEAFAGCVSDLTLYGAVGSVAEEYARENGLRFEAR